jgi:ribosomal protein L6P/L9E
VSGAKTPIEVPIIPNTKVEVKGRDVIITSIDKEAAGTMAGRIENATRVGPEFDPRKFQDGIYIVEKGVWGE